MPVISSVIRLLGRMVGSQGMQKMADGIQTAGWGRKRKAKKAKKVGRPKVGGAKKKVRRAKRK